MTDQRVRYWLRTTGTSWHEVDETTYYRVQEATAFTRDETGPLEQGFRAPGVQGRYTLLGTTPTDPVCPASTDQLAELNPTVQPKASFQKDDCLTAGCDHPSSLEVRLPLPQPHNGLIQIRCCDQPQCISNATLLALLAVVSSSPTTLAHI